MDLSSPKLVEMLTPLNKFAGDNHQNNYALGLHDKVDELNQRMADQNMTGTYDYGGGGTMFSIPITGLTQNDFLHLSIVTQTNDARKTAQSIPAAGGQVDLTFSADPGATSFSFIVKKGSA